MKRRDLTTICILGSGPVVIGQAAEFDYSGTQAVKALKEEGYKVVLINSNPASIMTKSSLADKTYVEPLTLEYVEKILEIERPCAILPTVGGQTALNLAIKLHEQGVLNRLNIELIGADIEAIKKAEDRELFKEVMEKAGLKTLKSHICRNEEDAKIALENLGLPMVIRPSFTLGGSGGGIAYTEDEYFELIQFGLRLSPNHQILVEESVIGHKEYEFEVIRDEYDNAVIICSIENFDPMGVHTGDSITVAPAQTLSDVEYQTLRDASLKVLRAIGVKTGGSNVQFSVNPKTGEFHVIEMNPRVSRSSALASKATGYPIAKVAAKLAVGYGLHELTNDITKKSAAFEPALDYVVVKIPRFAFEKFLKDDPILTTQMRSVGEVMAIGRSFKEALHKALVSLEDCTGFDQAALKNNLSMNTSMKEYLSPTPKRLWRIAEGFRRGLSVEEVFLNTNIDRWFLCQIKDLMDLEEKIASTDNLLSLLPSLKSSGFLDARIAKLSGLDELTIFKMREKLELFPVFRRVDTCAAEFFAHTPYLYSTYEEPSYQLTNDDELKKIHFCEANPSTRQKIIILGSGSIRIGQGIEFDCCATESVPAFQGLGFETIMINCNPETVSTDFDTSDRLYFEPLTFEHVMNIIRIEKPFGVVVQLGGQTPLSLAQKLYDAKVNVLGTSPKDIHRAEDREHSAEVFSKLGLRRPPSFVARNFEEAHKGGEKIGYPLMIRPSYVLGGQAMERVYNSQDLKASMARVFDEISEPVFIDRFLDGAVELDVDAVADGEHVYVAGILEHIEEAGIHSGDSACVLPPFGLSMALIAEIHEAARALCHELKIIGLINIQFAVKDGALFVIEVNPRASRTVPFVSKFTNVCLAELAAQVMAGHKLPHAFRDNSFMNFLPKNLMAIKAPVMPFLKFPNSDPLLGPQMRSTGEVMAIASCFESALLKSHDAIGTALPKKGNLFVSLADRDKEAMLFAIEKMVEAGFSLLATSGTHWFLKAHGLKSLRINKVREGSPHVLDLIENGQINLMFNTVLGSASVHDSHLFRKKALLNNVPYFTSVFSARALAKALASKQKDLGQFVIALQDIHERVKHERI